MTDHSSPSQPTQSPERRTSMEMHRFVHARHPTPSTIITPPPAPPPPQTAASSSRQQQPQQQQQQQYNNVPVATTTSGGSSSSSSGTGGGLLVPQPTKRTPSFIRRLWEFVNDPAYCHVVTWTQLTPASFIIKDTSEFTLKVLPKLLKFANYTLFLRQLGDYGFERVVTQDPSVTGFEVFYHDKFRRNAPHMLKQIQRRRSRTSAVSASVASSAVSTPSIDPPTALSTTATPLLMTTGTPSTESDLLSRMMVPALGSTPKEQAATIQSLVMQLTMLQIQANESQAIVEQVKQEVLSSQHRQSMLQDLTHRLAQSAAVEDFKSPPPPPPQQQQLQQSTIDDGYHPTTNLVLQALSKGGGSEAYNSGTTTATSIGYTLSSSSAAAPFDPSDLLFGQQQQQQPQKMVVQMSFQQPLPIQSPQPFSQMRVNQMAPPVPHHHQQQQQVAAQPPLVQPPYSYVQPQQQQMSSLPMGLTFANNQQFDHELSLSNNPLVTQQQQQQQQAQQQQQSPNGGETSPSQQSTTGAVGQLSDLLMEIPESGTGGVHQLQGTLSFADDSERSYWEQYLDRPHL